MGLFSWLFGRRSTEVTHDHDEGGQSANLASRSFADGQSLKPTAVSMPGGRFGLDRHMPEGKWVRATVVEKVAGMGHRKDAASAFARAVWTAEKRGTVYGLRLEPDPTNAYDRKAIKIFGVVGSEEWHIGFVDADTAADISTDIITRDLPIAGELYEVYIGHAGFVDVKYLVLAPPGNSVSARAKRRSKAASM